jgi:hypothetical protein
MLVYCMYIAGLAMRYRYRSGTDSLSPDAYCCLTKQFNQWKPLSITESYLIKWKKAKLWFVLKILGCCCRTVIVGPEAARVTYKSVPEARSAEHWCGSATLLQWEQIIILNTFFAPVGYCSNDIFYKFK